MKTSELYEDPQTYYHGSDDELPIGTVLTPRENNYEDNWGHNNWYQALEKYRPSKSRPHSLSVFMVDNEDDLDLAAGGPGFIFRVEPIGEISRHDLNWGSEISGLFDEGYDMFSDEIEEAALNYWNGVPHFNESIWEYLVPKAKIISVEPYELYEDRQSATTFSEIEQQAEQWNPRFFYTDTAYDSADAINKPHEDYPSRVEATQKIIEMLVSGDYTSITEFDAKSIHSFIFKGGNIITGKYRDISVTVGGHSPPDAIHIPELISNIFPVSTSDNLEKWYSLFQTIHPYEDGNGRVGGVIIAVLSKLKSDKFLTPKQ